MTRMTGMTKDKSMTGVTKMARDTYNVWDDWGDLDKYNDLDD